MKKRVIKSSGPLNPAEAFCFAMLFKNLTEKFKKLFAAGTPGRDTPPSAPDSEVSALFNRYVKESPMPVEDPVIMAANRYWPAP